MVKVRSTRKKSTYFLSEEILKEIKEIVPAKGLRSLNALVEDALRNYVAEFKRDNLRRQYLEASRDPRFLADVKEVEKAFRKSDAETAKMIR
jgi:metal-responsive CopG/Arc/MetJ family transcriptional regulator